MTVVGTSKDAEALTLTFVAEFDASVERVWQVWEDPRQLERWWGPPTWPATFARHEFVVGGESRYYMTSPEGEKSRGWWRFVEIDPPNRLEFQNGFSGDDGEPIPGMEPIGGVVTLEGIDGGTRMTTVNVFSNTEQLEQVLAMGMEEGMRSAMGQIDSILANE
jgi:uncharacterized protein YndB with AHSA1/START domain